MISGAKDRAHDPGPIKGRTAGIKLSFNIAIKTAINIRISPMNLEDKAITGRTISREGSLLKKSEINMNTESTTKSIRRIDIMKSREKEITGEMKEGRKVANISVGIVLPLKANRLHQSAIDKSLDIISKSHILQRDRRRRTIKII